MGIGTIQNSQINQLTTKEKVKSTQNLKKDVELEKLSLKILQKFPSFSLDNLVADWVFLKFLLYFGDGEARSATGYSLVPEYFEAVVNHDPRFIQAYLALSPANSLYAGQPQKTVTLI
ncbi:MAG: hypothetical protein BRC36_13380, partial [Cyanobacteria bacterium QH_2_48_84]